MNGSSWKWGFALFMFAVVSFSAFVIFKPKPQLKISYDKADHNDPKWLAPRGGDDVGTWIQNDASHVILKEQPTDVQILMQVALSLMVAAVSLFIIVAARFGPKDKHWAYATVGTILGFWLHGGLK
jgi:hypothetical protein